MIKYVVLTYNSWNDVELNVGLPLDKNPLFGSGFLCVFDSVEEAEEHWPEKYVHAIRFATIPKETDNE